MSATRDGSGTTEATGADPSPDRGGHRNRGSATVVGVAVLLFVTVASLAALTVGVGMVVESGASTAAADRVAEGFAGLEPRVADSTQTTVPLAGGRLAVEPRTVRVSDETGTVARYDADALVYETGDRRVTFLLGTVVRGDGANAALRRPPPVTAAGGTLVVGLPVLDATGAGAASGAGEALVRADVRHRHRRIGPGTYTVAVETATPGAWEAAFADRGVGTVRTDGDGDGVPSVVARYPAATEAHLVVHRVDLRMEVRP